VRELAFAPVGAHEGGGAGGDVSGDDPSGLPFRREVTAWQRPPSPARASR
jgi:hypothetical protein